MRTKGYILIVLGAVYTNFLVPNLEINFNVPRWPFSIYSFPFSFHNKALGLWIHVAQRYYKLLYLYEYITSFMHIYYERGGRNFTLPSHTHTQHSYISHILPILTNWARTSIAYAADCHIRLDRKTREKQAKQKSNIKKKYTSNSGVRAQLSPRSPNWVRAVHELSPVQIWRCIRIESHPVCELSPEKMEQ